MILLTPLFYAVYLIFWGCILGVALTIYVGFWILAFLTAVVIELVNAVARRRRPKNPALPKKRPIPQAHWSNRR